ncbi:hypothetical protein [Marinomonas transparens]|uniref:Uncharacterized protein n=1 Tax=Marinomonas transparens TaxID=2795388 RepID=A0A934JXJ6_9GAMM|nr:hypothetical protein [Marinomonas transparens]MBJ7539105.1 hypothetical protein [Marinomonas transparens]
MTSHASFSLLTQKSQTGWIMVEMVLCLALLAVVLHLAQRQSANQWQSIQVAEQQRQYRESQYKQAQMKSLTGSDNGLNGDNTTNKADYPSCQLCTGDDLIKWFNAAQGAGTNLIDR